MLQEICCLVIAPKDSDRIVVCNFPGIKDDLMRLGKIAKENNFEEVLKDYHYYRAILYTECEGDRLSHIGFEDNSIIHFLIKNYRNELIYIEADNKLYRENIRKIVHYKVPPKQGSCYTMDLTKEINKIPKRRVVEIIE